MEIESVAVSELAKIAQCEGMVFGELQLRDRARPVDNGAAADRGISAHRQHDRDVRLHMVTPFPTAPAQPVRREILAWLWTLLRALFGFGSGR